MDKLTFEKLLANSRSKVEVACESEPWAPHVVDTEEELLELLNGNRASASRKDSEVVLLSEDLVTSPLDETIRDFLETGRYSETLLVVVGESGEPLGQSELSIFKQEGSIKCLQPHELTRDRLRSLRREHKRRRQQMRYALGVKFLLKEALRTIDALAERRRIGAASEHVVRDAIALRELMSSLAAEDPDLYYDLLESCCEGRATL